MTPMRVLCACAALWLPALSAVMAAPGDLDPTFGGTGILTADLFNHGDDHAFGVAVQTDGKIVAAGLAYNGSNYDFALLRYLANGSLDPGFGAAGKVATDFGGVNAQGFAVALQSDGKIVVVGTANGDFALARYNPDGSLDTSFNGNGKVTTDIGSGSGDVANSVVVESDGKIVVAGISNNSFYDIAVARYNADGSLDTSFNGGGIVTTSSDAGYNHRCSAAVQADGKIVVASPFNNGSTYDIAVVRYKTDGTPDTSFNSTGQLITPIGSTEIAACSVAVQSSGRIVVAGTSGTNPNQLFAVFRYNSDGMPDTSFNGSGMVTTAIGTGVSDGPGIALQSDGKIVLAGTTSNGFFLDYAVLRYNADGTLDTSFNGNGKVETDVGGGGLGYSVALQSDGGIVVAGDHFNGDFDFGLVRYKADGTLDRTFGAGKVTTAIGSGDDEGRSLAVQSDGKIVVGGHSYNGTDDDFALLRYASDGTLDGTFGSGGKVTTDLAGDNDQVRGVAIQTDGKIVAAGFADGGPNDDFAVTRYTSSGSLDPSFGAGGKVITPIGSGHDYGQAVALQSDGKIVVAGQSHSGSDYDIAVVRYNTNGSLDSTFHGDGKVVTAIGGFDDVAYSVVVQSDGKIVVAGTSNNGSNDGFVVVRYNTDGSLDTSFNSVGKVVVHIGSFNDDGYSMAVQNDGKIVVAGKSHDGSSENIALIRLLADGGLDLAFNSIGVLVTDLGGANDYAYGLALQPDGKIIVAGYSFSTGADLALARYNVDGSLDSTFQGTGAVTTALGAADDYGYAVALQADGRIVVAGSSFNGPTMDFAVARYLGGPEPAAVSVAASGVQSMQATLSASVNPNGLDTMVHFEYGTDPTLTVASSTSDFDIGSGTSALPEDQPATGLTPNTTYYYRVVATNAAGMSFGSILSFTTLPSAPAVSSIAADQVHAYSARLRGTVDAFGQATAGFFEYGTDPALNGAATTSNVNLGSGQGVVPLGQVVTGLELGRTYYYRARATNGTGTTYGSILSFTTAAVPGDATAGFDPYVSNTVFSTAVQPDGKIVIGGAFGLVRGILRDSLARLNRDGTVDLAFVANTDGTVFSTAVQADGRILVGGSFTHVNGMAANCLARLNADGTLDTGFTAVLDAEISSLAVQTDGRIIIAGGFDTVNGATHHHVARLNADGSLDPNFNADADIGVSGVTLQPDGMILLAGSFTTVNNTARFYFARLQADGSLDTNFAPTTDGSGLCTAVQADGKIVISGGFALAGGMPHHGLARLNADGSLDGFFSPDVDNDVRSVVIQSDGQIIIGGFFSMVAGTPRSRLARLQAAGTLDPNFNPSADADVFSTALLPDGRIMVGGNFANIGGTARTGLALLENAPAPQSLAVTSAARVEWLRGGSSPETQTVSFELSTDGGTSWAPLGAATRIAGGWELTGLNLPAAGAIRARARLSGGLYNGSPGLAETVTVFPIAEVAYDPNVNAKVQVITLQPDGQVIIGGTFSSVSGMPRIRLARLRTDGSLDPGFAPSFTGSVGEINAILVQADGRIVVGGAFTAVDGVTRNRLARLKADGSLDPSFDPNLDGGVFSVAEQADGKLLVGGSFSSAGADPRDRIARLNPDGSLDTAFHPGLGGPGSEVFCFAPQADGRILVGGFFDQIAGAPRSFLARLNEDGTLDPTFAPEPAGAVYSVAVQPDGRIVTGGSFSKIGGVVRTGIARLNADGSLDPTVNIDLGFSVNTVVLQADGEILVGGEFSSFAGLARHRLARLQADGSVDPGFDPDANSFVSGLTLQPDGKILIGGDFSTVGGVTRNGLARLDNGPATQSLSAASTSRVQWLRGGSSPEAQAVTFELSTDAGTNWTPLGLGTRIAGGWELAGLNLPAAGSIRARARVVSGFQNGSAGLVETVTPYEFATTGAATLITSTGANVGGSLNPNGLPTQVFFQYGTDPALVGASSTASASAGSGTTSVSSTGGLGNLTPGTTYYYRIVAMNSAGTFYGNILSFVTAPGIIVGPIINPTNKHLYYLLSTDTWTGSEARAVTMGGHLATINDAVENQWVFDTFAHFGGVERVLWIGLYDAAQTQTFVWASGDALDFTNWDTATGQPDFGDRFVHLGPSVGPITPAKWSNVGDSATEPHFPGLFFHGVVEIPNVDLVVNTDADVPGETPGTTFLDLGSPAVDAGQVGGAATIKEPGKKPVTVIYGDSDGLVLARTGGDAPGGATFTALGDPVFGGGAFGFAGKARATSGSVVNGLFSKLSTLIDLKQVAVQGGGAPGLTGPRFAKLPSFGLPRKRPGLVFSGKLRHGGGVSASNDLGVWREQTDGADSDLLLRTGSPVTTSAGDTPAVKKIELMIPVENATDQRRSFAPDGSVAVAAAFADGTNGIVVVAPDGTKSVPVDTKSAVPGLPGARFLNINPPAAASSGLLAFHAALTAALHGQPPPPREAIYLSRNGSREEIAKRDDPAPGRANERLHALGQPLLGQSGLLAFVATLQRIAGEPPRPVRGVRNRKAIVQLRGVTKSVAISEGDPAPDCGDGVVIQRLLSVVATDTPGGHLVFTALVTGGTTTKLNRQAMWSISPEGTIRLLLRSDQLVVVNQDDMPKLRSFEALQAKPASKGQGRGTDELGFVTAKVRLDGGRTGVLRIPL